MEITDVQFVKSIRGSDPILFEDVPHIAFVGRSNVGKSSVLRRLLGKSTDVRISSTPGATQRMNLFLVNNAYYFVDLPGYGFTRISQKQTERLQKMLVWYLTESGVRPRWVVLIVDARVGATERDHVMRDTLREENHSFLVLANKIDKVKQSKRHATRTALENEFTSAPVIPFSAETGEGRDVLLDTLSSEH